MIDSKVFIDHLGAEGFDFYVGVPDSLLKSFCACVTNEVPEARRLIAANEGNAVALACGWHLATGGAAVVFMQNSGEGNAVNPLLSLADPDVYSIPMLLLIGWRGQPGIKDEPQHVKQGRVTCSLLETMELPYVILGEDWQAQVTLIAEHMWSESRPVALVVPEGSFIDYPFEPLRSDLPMTREQALEAVLDSIANGDAVVSTTGKESRELFELREARGEHHGDDFLTVGGMGHTSSIALGIALGTDRNVWCLDGDGSMIMHMGALAVAGQIAPANFKYIVNDNAAHESVGGQPTASSSMDILGLLHACGFDSVFEAKTPMEARLAIAKLRDGGFGALVLRTRQGARSNLGRPTTTPVENKDAFMSAIRNVCAIDLAGKAN